MSIHVFCSMLQAVTPYWVSFIQVHSLLIRSYQNCWAQEFLLHSQDAFYKAEFWTIFNILCQSQYWVKNLELAFISGILEGPCFLCGYVWNLHWNVWNAQNKKECSGPLLWVILRYVFLPKNVKYALLGLTKILLVCRSLLAAVWWWLNGKLLYSLWARRLHMRHTMIIVLRSSWLI